MNTPMINTKRPVGMLLASILVITACGDDAVSPPAADTDQITIDIESMLVRSIQDEYHAENIYLRVLQDHGDVLPFVNVVHAEERHSESIGRMFTVRGLAVPVSDWNLTNVPGFTSVSAACNAAVVAEIANIELYDELLLSEMPEDIERVFESNRAASLDRHLPAFEGCK